MTEDVREEVVLACCMNVVRAVSLEGEVTIISIRIYKGQTLRDLVIERLAVGT